MTYPLSLRTLLVMNPVLITMNTVPCCRAETSSFERQLKNYSHSQCQQGCAGVAHLRCFFSFFFEMVRSLHPSLPVDLPPSSWLVGSSLQHTTQSCEHRSKRPRASQMMSVKYFMCCEKDRMRDTSVHQGEIDIKKKKSI